MNGFFILKPLLEITFQIQFYIFINMRVLLRLHILHLHIYNVLTTRCPRMTWDLTNDHLKDEATSSFTFISRQTKQSNLTVTRYEIT